MSLIFQSDSSFSSRVSSRACGRMVSLVREYGNDPIRIGDSDTAPSPAR